MYFLFIRLIFIFVDMYTNILKITFYKNKSICILKFFIVQKTKLNIGYDY
jgi:hypothetical protein